MTLNLIHKFLSLESKQVKPAMVSSSSYQILSHHLPLTLSSSSSSAYYHSPKCCTKLIASQKSRTSCFIKSYFQVSASSLQWQHTHTLIKSIPVAASLVVLLWSAPASAGFLSGISGIESVPGPDLPKVEFLQKFNEENQKQYAEFDKRFNESPLLKKLLEKSKLNKEKNQQEIQDKYCLRGAEWGVGDCSAEGMTEEDKDKFIAMLKAKVGE